MEVIGIWLMVAAVVAQVIGLFHHNVMLGRLYDKYKENNLIDAQESALRHQMYREQHGRIMKDMEYRIDASKLERDLLQKKLDNR